MDKTSNTSSEWPGPDWPEEALEDFKDAVREAIAEHHANGRPVYYMKDGKMVEDWGNGDIRVVTQPAEPDPKK